MSDPHLHRFGHTEDSIMGKSPNSQAASELAAPSGSARLWTAICRCRTCNREINRAEHVPTHEKMRVSVSAALMALCEIKAHNTGSDYNLNFDLAWHEEAPNAKLTDGAGTKL